MDPLDLQQLVRQLVALFYGDFDNWRRGVEHSVSEVLPAGTAEAADLTQGTLLVYRWESDGDAYESAFYRVGWRLGRDESGALASGPYGLAVEFDPFEDWARLEAELVWTEAERAAALLEKREQAHGVQRAFGPAADVAAVTRRVGTEAALPETDLRYLVSSECRMASDDNTSTVFFTTEALDRHVSVFRTAGIDYAGYLADNPVVMYDHGEDPVRGRFPIGRTLSIEPKTVTRGGRSVNGLLARFEWYDDEFSQRCKDAFKRGFLNMASIGALPVELGEATEDHHGRAVRVPVFERSEMLEFSIVTVGSNRLALAQDRSAARPASRPALPAGGAPRRSPDLAALQSEVADLRRQLAARADAPAAPQGEPVERDAPEQRADDGAAAPNGSADERTAPAAAPAVPVIPEAAAAALIERAVEAGLSIRREQEAAPGRRLVDSLTGRG